MVQFDDQFVAMMKPKREEIVEKIIWNRTQSQYMSNSIQILGKQHLKYRILNLLS